MNRPLRLAECSQPISWVFCVYFVGGRCIIATRQQCCCNPFRMHSRNVRNVFVICVLHIRRVKVWFLRCKSMVFGVQKYGFCFLRECFLFCNTSYRTHEHPQMALQYIVPRPRTPPKWRCVGAIWLYNIYLFLGIAHLFISY